MNKLQSAPERLLASAFFLYLSLSLCSSLFTLTGKDAVAETIDPTTRAFDLSKDLPTGELQSRLQTRVRIKYNEGKGHIQIDYFSLEEFDRVFDLLFSF